MRRGIMHICIMYEKYFLNRHSEQSYLLQVKENAHLGSSWTYQNSKRHRISTHELIKISVVSRNLVAICGKPSASLRAVSALNPCNACWKKIICVEFICVYWITLRSTGVEAFEGSSFLWPVWWVGGNVCAFHAQWVTLI